MKALIALTALLWTMGFVAPAMAADQKALDEFENRAKRLNALGADKFDLAIQRISTETGVPVDTIRRQHERHPDTGIAGLMVANVLANETKKIPETFLSQRAAGKNWVTIAKENKVSVDTLNQRLARLERAIKGNN